MYCLISARNSGEILHHDIVSRQRLNQIFDSGSSEIYRFSRVIEMTAQFLWTSGQPSDLVSAGDELDADV